MLTPAVCPVALQMDSNSLLANNPSFRVTLMNRFELFVVFVAGVERWLYFGAVFLYCSLIAR